MKVVVRFRKKGKLITYYMVPYKILQRVGKVAYELKLPSELSSVHPVFHISMLKKCIGNTSPFFLSKVLVCNRTSPMKRLWWK